MLRLRQVAFAARDLARAEDDLVEALDLERCYQDPNVIVFGLENALFPVGDQFLEIVSPVRPDTTAGRLLDKRDGDTGYMVLFQVDDLTPVEERLERLGTRIVFDASADDIRGLHLHPKDVPGAIVSIDAAVEPTEWPWAGPSWRDHVRTRTVSCIAGLTVAAADPDAVCSVWGAVLGVEPTEGTLRVDDARVHFRAIGPDGREGIVRMQLATPEPRRVGAALDVLGVTVELVAEHEDRTN